MSEAQRDRLGAVGVVQIARAPKAEVEAGPKGAKKGTAQRGAEGALAGAGAFFIAGGSGSCSGSACGAAIIFLPIFVAAGALVGALNSGPSAVPDDKARQIESALKVALADEGSQQALRSEVVKAAERSGIADVKDITTEAATMGGEEADYRTLAQTGLDTVLEVGLVEVRLVGTGGKDPELALSVHAVARLIDVKTNAELYRDYAFYHTSPRKPFSEWSADEARVLREELSRSYGTLGTTIVDEIFLTVRTN